jgi:hypothetical protein
LDYGRIIGTTSHDVFAATNKGDPELLHIHPPHSHFSGEARGGNITSGYHIPRSDMGLYRWDVSYDQNGFRNDQELKSADMVVIGDSFVEDITIPTAELTTSLLAHLRSDVVANLGQYGYGPLEELAVLRRYGLPLRPRTIVWMFFEGNDLKDVIHFRKVTAEAGKPVSFWLPAWHRSFTYNALAQFYSWYKRFSRPSGIKRSAVLRPPNGEAHTAYFVYSSPPLSNDDLSAFDETTRKLAAAHTLSAAQGARLIVVFVPTKFRVFHSFCRFPEQSECRNWVLNDLPERLKRSMESISPDIGFLDLTPKLVNAVQTGSLPYCLDDDHWSPAGHQVAAEAINDYLLSMQPQSLPK